MSEQGKSVFDWAAYPWLEPYATKLKALAVCLRDWNARINLVSRKDIDNLEAHHLLPCASLRQMTQLDGCRTHLDIGTGGGLPGLVIAILYPGISCTLLDSTAKKLGAVESIANELELANVKTMHARVESHHRQYDVITGRAVTALPRFLGWTPSLLSPKAPSSGGVYYWKGGALESELKSWNLKPCSSHSLEAATGDPYFCDKHIVHFYARDILGNRPLAAAVKAATRS